jgi:hypothetical protein
MPVLTLFAGDHPGAGLGRRSARPTRLPTLDTSGGGCLVRPASICRTGDDSRGRRGVAPRLKHRGGRGGFWHLTVGVGRARGSSAARKPGTEPAASLCVETSVRSWQTRLRACCDREHLFDLVGGVGKPRHAIRGCRIWWPTGQRRQNVGVLTVAEWGVEVRGTPEDRCTGRRIGHFDHRVRADSLVVAQRPVPQVVGGVTPRQSAGVRSESRVSNHQLQNGNLRVTIGSWWRRSSCPPRRGPAPPSR